MKKSTKSRQILSNSKLKLRYFSNFRLESSYVVFGLLLMPVSFLFLQGATISRSLLTIYVVIMINLGLILLLRFIVNVARAANNRNGRYGDLLIHFIPSLLFNLIMFKFYGYLFIALMPRNHSTIIYKFSNYVLRYYKILDYQDVLNGIIIGSLIIVAFFTYRAIGTENRN